MKKFINEPANVVEEMIQGMLLAHPDLIQRVPGYNVLIRKTPKENHKVSLVSGGGSGHEPAHGGYIGEGMLDAAVVGAVFTSPTPDQILEAIRKVATPAGVLLIIKNYTGDVLNFELAAEMAEAEGIRIAKVLVNDDVAVENSTYTVGRRGIVGTVLVHKIAGAAAELGKSLDEVKAIAEKVVSRMRSIGVALSACTVPEVGKPGFQLEQSEMELGLGIHGEPGIKRIPIETADVIAKRLLDHLLTDDIQVGDEIAMVVNGLGGTPLMELYIMNRALRKAFGEWGGIVFKTYVGNYMTSLEMQGISVTLLKLDQELKKLLLAPSNTITF